MIFTWYVDPLLENKTIYRKLEFLLWFHVFRYAPLVLLSPEQTNPRIPIDVLQVIALGDFVSALLALTTVILLKYNKKGKGAITSTWIFLLVSTIDMISVFYLAISQEIYLYNLNYNWLILSFYVPLLLVTKIKMLQILLRQNSNNI